ncbi:very short patch repair endonuclease [Draconibacterium sp.]|nr:very short patch repair endonuclease [Draconibacterium sp.]
MDVHGKLTRSYNMRRIKGKNTKPELKISGAKCMRNFL